jgi:predicted phosphodiesterase
MEAKRIEVDDGIDSLFVAGDHHSFIEPLEAIDGIIASWPGSVQVVVAGDIVGKGASPVETVEWVRTRAGEFAVIGGHDRLCLRGEKGDHPPYTEAGAYQRLDRRQIEYLRALPWALELAWRGKLIRVTHGQRGYSDEEVSSKSKPSEMISRFSDTATDLTVVAHTHYPFVSEQDGCRVANCGSTAGLLMGLQHQDGAISSRDNEAECEAGPNTHSTFLAVTIEGDELKVTVQRFDCDRRKAFARLREAKDQAGVLEE